MTTLLRLAAPLLALVAGCSAGPDALTTSASSPAGAFDQEHTLLDGLLARHARPAGVDYLGLAAEAAELDRYLASLHAVTPDELAGWSRDQRFAFWINTYNAHILRLIIDHADELPASIKDLGGALVNRIWDQPLIPMDAHHPSGTPGPLSLNDVEHEVLRPRFADARLHAAINCASVSCPPLLPEAFRAATLEEQLERAMTDFVGDPSRNAFDRDAGRLRLSAIFDWFPEDFEADEGSVRAYARRYAPAAARGDDDGAWIEAAKVGFLDYDWNLNDAPR